MAVSIGHTGYEVGQLREKIEFYKLVSVSDNAGGTTATKTLDFSLKASLTSNKSDWRVAEAQGEVFNGWEVVIRNTKNKKPSNLHLVKYDGEFYRILGNKYIDIYKRYIRLTIVKEE